MVRVITAVLLCASTSIGIPDPGVGEESLLLSTIRPAGLNGSSTGAALKAEATRLQELGFDRLDAGETSAALLAWTGAVQAWVQVGADPSESYDAANNIAHVLVQIGYAHWVRGEFRPSCEAYREAVKAGESLSASTGDSYWRAFTAMANSGLGSSYLCSAETTKSLELARLALQQAGAVPPQRTSLGDVVITIPDLHCRLGEANLLTGRIAEAKRHYQEAVTMVDKRVSSQGATKPASETVMAFLGLGAALEEDGDTSGASKASERGLEAARELQAGEGSDPVSRHYLSQALSAKANSLVDQARTTEAMAYIEEAFAIDQDLRERFPDDWGYAGNLASNHLLQASVLKEQGNPKWQNHAEQALQVTQKYVSTENAFIMETRARAYALLERWEDAHRLADFLKNRNWSYPSLLKALEEGPDKETKLGAAAD